MAHNVSNEYKQVIYSGDARNKLKLLFNNVELQDADRYCERLTIKSRIVPNGAKIFSLNNFISKEAELILHDIDTSIIQDQVSISIGTLVGNSYEYVPIGIFNIQDTPTNDKNKTTIKLRDNSVKFDFNYNAKPLIDSGGGTATKLQILQDICSKAGVTCNISSFIGSTDRVGIYDNTITARQYIADLAEQAGRIATINRSGELIFVNINDLTTWNIPLSIVERYELGKAYRIGKVVYEDGVRKYETASTTYDTLFLDASNPYVSSQAQVNSILQQVNAFEIDSVKTGKILGNPAIDGYDLINIYNDKVEGNPSIFKTLATNDLTYTGVLINTFDTQIGEDDREQNVSILGEATFKKWAKTEIDNINGEITLQAGKITTLEESIEVYSVDLDIYNITTPVGTDKKPLENKTYQIGYYAYYKGNQVTPSVTALSTATGITQTIANNKINLAVSTSTAISNLTNELSYRFDYTADGETYSVTKKIVVVISQKGETGATGPQGEQGIPGPAGSDGTSSYFYVRYSANSSGNPMTTTPQSDTQYMGVASTTSSTAPTSPSAYTWSKTKGEQGEQGIQGIQGQTGADGRSSYLHIKYSEDGTTFTPAQSGYAEGKKPSRWQGTYVDFNSTDSNTFSDYNWVDTAIMVEDLLTPTNTLSGTSIQTTDATDTDLLYFELEGKTTQATRSGKNLANNLDFTFTSDGTSSYQWNYRSSDYIPIENNTYYALSFYFNDERRNDNTYGNAYAYLYDENKTLISNTDFLATSNVANSIKQNTNANAKYLMVKVGVRNYVSGDNIKVQLEKNNTVTAYESYGAMPSPDFPSELVSVGYENLWELPSTSTANGITYTKNDDGSFNISGTASAITGFVSWFPLSKLENNVYYTLSCNQTIPSGLEFRFEEYTAKNGSWIKQYNILTSSTTNPRATKVTKSTGTYVRVNIVVTSGTSLNLANVKIQLEKGLNVHDYIPYGKYGIEVKTTGKNLFDKTSTSYKKDYYINGAGSFVYNTEFSTFVLPISPNTTYTITNSGQSGAPGYVLYDCFDNFLTGTGYTTRATITFTTPNNASYIMFSVVTLSTSGRYDLDRFQLEQNSSATTYEEFKSKTFTYALDNPLRSIGDIKDLLYIKNGMLYVERKISYKRITSAMINSTYSNVLTYSKEARVDAANIDNIKLAWGLSLYSNCFKQRATWDVDVIGIMHYAGTPNSVAFRIPVNDDKTFFDNHEVYLQYVMNDVVTEELGYVDIPITYKPISNISNTDELNPNMSIIYVRDLPLTNYVESHYAELKINENSIESRVTSIENNGYGDRISAVETKQTSTDLTIGVITQNSGIELTYDSDGKPVSGKVTEVTTTTGFTFNAEGMTISNSDTNFIAQHTNEGTFYKDGDTIVGQYTKDGSKQKDLQLFGVYYYGMEDKDDTPMFVAQLFTDENNEVGVGHFYNRGD